MLQPGTYRLIRDVTNPDPDASQIRDWRKALSWPAGAEFVVISGRSAFHTRLTLTSLLHTYLVLYASDWRYRALEDALCLVEESDDAVLTELGVHDPFARWMLRTGKVDRLQLRQLWMEYRLKGVHVSRESSLQGEAL